ncbi:MAG TPA: cellulose biosynthesis protein BcsS [Nitrospira sp.]|nr:cellulose biosynthesis protein BcsS [Nitrospira sp.]
MARAQYGRFVIVALAAFLWGMMMGSKAYAGDAFTGYQVDNKGEYFAYLGIRTPLMQERNGFQPFIQVFGAGVGYTFKANGQERDANLESVTPSLGVKYTAGSWSFLGMAGPQFRWKQEDQPTGPRSHDNFIGTYLQAEAFRWQENGIFHAIASYTDIDGFAFGRVRKTWLTHKSDQGCCSWYVGGDLAGMGNNQFYAVQAGPLVQVPINIFWLTLRGGYQYSQTFRNGVYGGVELYFPF